MGKKSGFEAGMKTANVIHKHSIIWNSRVLSFLSRVLSFLSRVLSFLSRVLSFLQSCAVFP
jgi:hypothetical protein